MSSSSSSFCDLLPSTGSANRPVDLPVLELALLGAVIHLPARAAHHQTGPEPECEALSADALAGAHGGGVVERRERGGGRGLVAGVVLQEHADEQPVHEGGNFVAAGGHHHSP